MCSCESAAGRLHPSNCCRAARSRLNHPALRGDTARRALRGTMLCGCWHSKSFVLHSVARERGSFPHEDVAPMTVTDAWPAICAVWQSLVNEWMSRTCRAVATRSAATRC
ncbi:hypothetical protein TRVL_04674 [Trypanosoma vivax]|nr:hypothetical protein TRVL_04674 [Trypanosoma vivax]